MPRRGWLTTSHMAEQLDPVDLFNDALELPASERDTWLRAQCGDDLALYARLHALLAAHDSTSVDDAPLPDELGKYKIHGVLGKGAMGIVLEAEDRELGRRVALKLLPSDFSKNLGAVARLRREAQALARLGHPRIATLYSLEQVGGRDFITMEAIRGRTLQELIREALPTAGTIAIAIQIADALDAAHRAGVIHKDLKPANVMILEDGSVKVVDFGIAALIGEGPKSAQASHSPTGLTGTMGTPGYMSPEQYLGLPLDARSDVWAFGCVFYECLAGRPLFPTMAELRKTMERATRDDGAKNVADIVDPALLTFGRRLSQPPRAIRRIVRECLAVDPLERPQSFAQIREALVRYTHRARMRKIVAVAAVAAFAIVTMTLMVSRPRVGTLFRVENVTPGGASLRGQDGSGHVLWSATMPAGIGGNEIRPGFGVPPTIVELDTKRVGVLVASHQDHPPGRLWLLEGKNGNILWEIPANWQRPVSAQGIAYFRWTRVVPAGNQNLLAAAICDGIWYSMALFLVSTDGAVQAEYYHPGRLFFQSTVAFEKDGQPSLLLFGTNSSARFRREIVPFDTRTHCCCVLLLDIADVRGQAYPYSEVSERRDWPGMERASERAYLLIPPLSPENDPRINSLLLRENADGSLGIEAPLVDGRVFELDSELRPIACYCGPKSEAAEILDEHASSVRALYLRRGASQILDVPVVQ